MGQGGAVVPWPKAMPARVVMLQVAQGPGADKDMWAGEGRGQSRKALWARREAWLYPEAAGSPKGCSPC